MIVRCLGPEDVCSEDTLHRQFESARKTLVHFDHTQDLKDKIEMLNLSNGFKEYVVPRTKHQTGVLDDLSEIEEMKDTMGVPPLRISRLERDISIMAAIGMTVAETAETMSLSDSAIKAHRGGVVQKCFTPNLVSAIAKLLVHDIINTKELVSN